MKNARISTLLLMILFFSSCSTVLMTERKRMNFVSSRSIDPVALNYYYDYLGNAQLSYDVEKNQLVNRVANRIIAATEKYYRSMGQIKKLSRFEWEVNLVEDPSANAFVVGPGKIVIHTGLLPITQTEAGLAAVIGHEVAHALAKHAEERTTHAYLAQVGGLGVSMLFQKKSAEFQNSVQLAYGIGVQLGAMLPFSRKHEKEADRIGLNLMAIAGYDPYEAPRVWARMRNAFGDSNTPFLETHPSHSDREATLLELIPEALLYAETYGL